MVQASDPLQAEAAGGPLARYHFGRSITNGFIYCIPFGFVIKGIQGQTIFNLFMQLSPKATDIAADAMCRTFMFCPAPATTVQDIDVFLSELANIHKTV